MDSATTAPHIDDGDGAAPRYIIHPATLSSTSTLLALIVKLLTESRPAEGDEAHDDMLTKSKHMYDMTRVIKAELPADAVLERL